MLLMCLSLYVMLLLVKAPTCCGVNVAMLLLIHVAYVSVITYDVAVNKSCHFLWCKCYCVQCCCCYMLLMCLSSYVLLLLVKAASLNVTVYNAAAAMCYSHCM